MTGKGNRRVVDDYENVFFSGNLHKAFVKYCNDCNDRCPMGCCYRKDWKRMDPLDPSSASILGCFARFVLSKAGEDDDSDK